MPPLSPNELALLASIVVLSVAWRTVRGVTGLPGAMAAAVGLGLIWVTGSRTALLMLLVALAVMALHLRRPRAGLVAGALVLAAAASAAAMTTGLLAGFAERDGTGTSTLQSRFIAWRAAGSWAASTWQTVFGGGLSVKIIRVKGQSWDEQPLDSSWVSALVQTGVLGSAVALCWVLWVLRGVLRTRREHRALFLGLLFYLIGRSVLESGLFDATPAFLAFVTVSLLAEGASRGPGAPAWPALQFRAGRADLRGATFPGGGAAARTTKETPCPSGPSSWPTPPPTCTAPTSSSWRASPGWWPPVGG